MERERIHPQLLADCHVLGSLAATELLLNRNASLPWFILLPETELEDLLDLPEEHRAGVMDDCALVAAFIKRGLGCEKLNFAGLGNVVPQMHLHVIGRSRGDACWPQPVWGNLPAAEGYPAHQLRDWQGELVRMAGLVPAPLQVNVAD